MNNYTSTLLVLILSCFGITGFGQSLKGTVVNEQNQPLEDVNIVNTNSGIHAHTNSAGAFVLEDAKSGDILDISHLGYRSKQLTLNDLNQELRIVLQSKAIQLTEVVIPKKVNVLEMITDIDIQTNPVKSSQDILQKVPGLFIGQHAGGGKAEQIFLRGFDIDHGTDIAISVDGMPVNMVSHAHGQGYSDLHFVIPETVAKIGFDKGPYEMNKGNFATAGYVAFSTKNKLDHNRIKLEAGQFNTQRLLGMFNLVASDQHNAYIATEYSATDGPFESPQNFNRINVFAKYRGRVNATDQLGITASYFSSKWDASGQIPQRAVDQKLITRFGAIDDTEGGKTSRANVLVHYDKFIDENTSLKNTVYASKYNFELYSNFTFFLDDPTNGDQIKQQESRNIIGLQSELKNHFSFGNVDGTWQAGINFRNDQSNDNELSHTRNRRTTLNRLKFGSINETNFGAYAGTSLTFNKWTINPSVRLDYFDFQYNDALQTLYSTQTATKAIVSPKLNIIYRPQESLQLYLKTGKGFHSNDTRVVVAQNGKKILPSAYGFDTGFMWKPSSKTLLNVAYWHLFSEQEFVYVGDAGIVEPSGKSRRQGVDLSFRYQPLSWLFWNFDTNYTQARAIEELAGNDFIPLAPKFTLVSGLNVNHSSGIFGSTQVRHIGDRPANEDNSIVAQGYTVVDFNVGYHWKDVTFGVQIQNLFDTAWNETQFATESRLQNEVQSVEEIHFTPGTPFFFKASIEYRF